MLEERALWSFFAIWGKKNVKGVFNLESFLEVLYLFCILLSLKFCIVLKFCCRTDSMHTNSESKVSATLLNKYTTYLLGRVADTLLLEFVCMQSVQQHSFGQKQWQ